MCVRNAVLMYKYVRGRMKRVGIFGGSFNPIHFGHIRLARQLLSLANLDEVWFVVSPQNPLKQQSDLIDNELRFEMVKLALHREKALYASDVEFLLPRPSYTWNTLEKLKADYPNFEFILLIGGDNWARFPMWYRSADIIGHYPIVVYPRTGSVFDMQGLPANVNVVHTRRINISSTMVRQRIREQQSISRLVPKTVASFIQDHHLYLD